jgi:hypothetical protein
MTRQLFQGIPPTHPNGAEHRRLIANVLNNVLRGKINSLGSVTLTLASTTTVVTDKSAGANSIILLMPLDANAAGESWWISGRDQGTFTINHSSAGTTRAFDYVILG